MSSLDARGVGIVVTIVACALAACGGQTNQASAGGDDAGAEAEASVDAGPVACTDYATPGEACRARADCRWIATNTRRVESATHDYCTFDSLLRRCAIGNSACELGEQCRFDVENCDPDNAELLVACGFESPGVCWPR
jgi:hypothetical protein